MLSKLSLAGLSLSWEDELSRGLGGYIVDTKSRHDFLRRLYTLFDVSKYFSEK